MTIITVWVWFKYDQHYSEQSDTDVSDGEMNKLEERIMEAIRDRTGTRVTTGLSDNRPPQPVPLPLLASPHNNSSPDRGFFKRLGSVSGILLGKPPGTASLPTVYPHRVPALPPEIGKSTRLNSSHKDTSRMPSSA